MAAVLKELEAVVHQEAVSEEAEANPTRAVLAEAVGLEEAEH